MRDDLIINPWKVKNQLADNADSFQIHSLPDGSLTPKRQLLHETITQIVTERQVGVNPDLPHDIQLFEKIEEIQKSDAFKTMAENGNFSREDVTRLLDKTELEKLPVVDASRHTTMMVTGGPATGKTALIERLAEANPDLYRNSVKINPDDYKAILADPAKYGTAYADIAHRESSLLSKSIMTRLEEKITNGQAPHVMLDVVAPNAARMELALKSNKLIVFTGSLDPEIAVERSYQRGLPKIDDLTGEIMPGRQTPTEIVLEGAKKVSETTPQIFNHKNVELRIYDTNVPYKEPQKLVAQWSPETGRIMVNNPDTFIDFVARQRLNQKASSLSELYTSTSRMPSQLAENLKTYTNKGIAIDFLTPEGNIGLSFKPEGIELNKPLPSNRGPQFFDDLAKAFNNTSAPSENADQTRHANPESKPAAEPRKNKTPAAPKTPTEEKSHAATVVKDTKNLSITSEFNNDKFRQSRINNVLYNHQTTGFMDPKTKTQYFVNTATKEVVIVDSKGGKSLQTFQNADETLKNFGKLIDKTGKTTGKMPTLVPGGTGALAKHIADAASLTGKFGKVANITFKILNTAAKILGPVGIVAAVAEIGNLEKKSQLMIQHGLLPSKALVEYDSLLTTHLAQGLLDPTIVGGELITQPWFNKWADKHKVPDYLRKELAPESLLKTLFTTEHGGKPIIQIDPTLTAQDQTAVHRVVMPSPFALR